MDGVVLVGGTPGADSASWADAYLVDLRQGFENLGLEAIHTRSDTAATRNAQDAFTRRGMRYFLVNINGILIDDHPRVPLFSWIVDHPLSHAHLSQAGEWDLLGMVDAGHAEIAGYSRAPACFVPHGGPLGTVLPPTGERPIEVLFSGNININTAISPRTLLEAAPLVIQDVADMAIADIIDGDSEPLAALMRAMQSRGIGFTDLDRASSARLLGFVIEYAQCHRRISILKKLAGFRVTVVGRLAPGVAEHLGDGLTLAGGCYFQDFFATAGRAKVLLNVSHKFPRGSHERIWYGMAAGNCVLTNRSSFLENEFVHGQDVLFYQGDGVDLDHLRHVIETGESLEIAAEGQSKFLRGHTWQHRAELVLALMRRHFGEATK